MIFDFQGCFFAMRRGGSGADFRTSGKGTRSEIITSLIGKDCGKDMIDFTHISQRLHYSAEVSLTPPVSSSTARSVQAKKVELPEMFFTLSFINGRLVQCVPLKYAVDSLFASQDLVSTFALIALSIDPSRIDVNVHPTKQTVMFLEEEAIIDDLLKAFHKRLGNVFERELAPSTSNSNRSLFTATQILKIPGQTQSTEVGSFH
ncbi:DNA mismatch repair protein [Cooperia oncophora]